MKKNKLVYILAGLVVVVGVVATVLIANGSASDSPNAASQANRSSSKDGSTQPTDGAETTLEGTFECLPPKGDGPQTLECAWGLKTNNGTWYALRADDPKLLSAVAMGSQIKVTGTITEEASDKYDTAGTIRVETAEQL